MEPEAPVLVREHGLVPCSQAALARLLRTHNKASAARFARAKKQQAESITTRVAASLGETVTCAGPQRYDLGSYNNVPQAITDWLDSQVRGPTKDRYPYLPRPQPTRSGSFVRWPCCAARLSCCSAPAVVPAQRRAEACARHDGRQGEDTVLQGTAAEGDVFQALRELGHLARRRPSERRPACCEPEARAEAPALRHGARPLRSPRPASHAKAKREGARFVVLDDVSFTTGRLSDTETRKAILQGSETFEIVSQNAHARPLVGRTSAPPAPAPPPCGCRLRRAMLPPAADARDSRRPAPRSPTACRTASPWSS